ncbi:MAG: DNA mismatch repair endonuclease MutL [Candidatus Azobacteroides sp.]|nr:DNA mismatch repair endonuclease MutL [Candidatus Azobacteroides sp.]
MNDIIHLLPDSVSNQIAAGEVVQRPASVVKELVENSLDAGATQIQVVIKDAGRTLIQVIDNGKGMSETDARMAFERHATSKITSANDLFALTTMGFRGEALASIAAVSHTELRTQQEGAELGTRICIAGSVVETQEEIAMPAGSNFMVKNLFYNVPARRKFLKSNEREFFHILIEFQRIVLVNPSIGFTLVHNNTEVFNLPATNIRQRIIQVFGKSAVQQKHLNQHLLNIDVHTTIATISGFVGKPETSKKRNDQQYFFVNGRYMRHSYFHKAVMQAYEPLIPAGEMPTYFIYLTVDPSTIDVNIHPTKTEIKFENEQAMWPILSAAVKEALGRFSVAPTIDFDREDAPEIPVFSQNNTNIQPPQPKFNTNYNPFKSSSGNVPRSSVSSNWEKLYEGFEREKGTHPFFEETNNSNPAKVVPEEEKQLEVSLDIQETNNHNLHFKGKYILTAIKSGLMLIDQHRAHVRILYHTYLNQIRNKKGASQKVLFPEIIDFSTQEAALLPLLLDDLHYMGFELNDMGNDSYAINGVPTGITEMHPGEIIKNMLHSLKEKGTNVKEQMSEALALSLAKNTAIPYGKTLSNEEMQHLIDQLFSTNAPNHTPDGKLILHILTNEELDKLFK